MENLMRAARPENVHAILLVDGMYALQLRDEHLEVAPGMWGLFGGHIEIGETTERALRREIQEELEIDIGAVAHFVDIAKWSFFVADVSNQWSRHILHEGQRADTFTPYAVETIRTTTIVRCVLAMHRMAVLAATATE